MRAGAVVWTAALLAGIGRFCGLLWPLRPDESGFLVVARTWAPTADSLYGPHFVDRPPLIIALVKATDAAGGPFFLRWVAAAGCVVSVLLAAAVVTELSRHLTAAGRQLPEPALRRVRGGTAILTAAFLTTPQIDALGAKGELLGVPLIIAGCLLALRALRTTSVLTTFAAGLVGMLAVGLKQSLFGALVLGGMLLLAALFRGAVTPLGFARLAAAAAGGALVPVLGTVLWAVAAGVDLSVLEYAVVSFRGDASQVIMETPSATNSTRARELVLHFLLCGMAFVALWGLVQAVRAVRVLTAPVVAAVVMLLLDLVVVGMSGSFWTPYLFTLVPSTLVLWACARVSALSVPVEQEQVEEEQGPEVVEPDSNARRAGRVASTALVAYCALSSVVLLGGWVDTVWLNGNPPRQEVMGRAIGEASSPGDTLVVYGGRADLQLASGLPSPYTHLWSLPMRTMDPELAELTALLEGPDAPTWFVPAVKLSSWDNLGGVLTDVVAERYTPVAGGCADQEIYRLRSAPVVEQLDTDCSTSWGRR